jgi:DNA polymerase epsilon subunit 1
VSECVILSLTYSLLYMCACVFGTITGEEGIDMRLGYMFNLCETTITDDAEDRGAIHSALDMYFVQEDGETFKASYALKPYLLIYVKDGGEDSSNRMQEVESFLLKTFSGLLLGVERVLKEDLDMANHLSGQQKAFLELRFRNQNDLLAVRNRLQPIVTRNQRERAAREAYDNAAEMAASTSHHAHDHLSVQRHQRQKRTTIIDNIIEIREYDLPYVQRICIDMGFRVGQWYEVKGVRGDVSCEFTKREDLLDRPLLKTLAYDIETTKLPLKFPDSTFDKVMMISYMIDGQGYLIVNREVREVYVYVYVYVCVYVCVYV